MIKSVSLFGGISHHFFVFTGDSQVDGGAMKVKGSPVSGPEFLPGYQFCMQNICEKGDHLFQVLADEMNVMKTICHRIPPVLKMSRA